MPGFEVIGKEEFAEIIEYPEIDPANGWPVALQEVWNLEV